MQVPIVSDTSCLILLEKIEALHVLRQLFGTILTTQKVAIEFGSLLPDWIIIRNPQDTSRQELLQTSLDEGEASAIALALEFQDCLLIIDELKGRAIAKQLGISITGTLGILADAKKSGLVPSVKPLLERIKQTNFRMNAQLEHEVLKQAGEL